MKHIHERGNPKAAVTLVEFADFECPYCGQAYPVVQELERAFGNDLKVVFKNFPLPDIHPHALQAAEAAEAAGEQDKFWEMHDLLFTHQKALTYNDLIGYAREIGLDLERFGQDLRDRTYARRIEQDIEEALRWGVPGTPSFVINGEFYHGPADFEALSIAIRRAQDEQLIRIAI